MLINRQLIYIASAILLSGISSSIAEQPNANCIPTKSDALGPFYVTNTPIVTDLNRFGKSGEVMHIKGRVLSASPPHPPIANAKVEIWQTDGKGRYYPQDNGDYSDYKDSDIDLRGTILTNSQGEFSVLSLFPHRYRPRPSHIHYHISALGYETLVTQHYLDVDASGDRICRTAKVDRNRNPAQFNAPIIYLSATGSTS